METCEIVIAGGGPAGSACAWKLRQAGLDVIVMSRREQIFSDDFVGVFLDTFNDRQRAYMFLVSPLGIQLDGIVTEGQNDDFSFDTIWQSRGEVTDFGFITSIAIPFKSLRFPPASGPQTWGISFMERFAGIEFREYENLITASTSYFKWMDVNGFVATGTRPNYYPSEGAAPFLANFRDAQVGLSFRPLSGLLLDETYIYSHLGTRTADHRAIFDNHIVRSRANYQFTRDLSLRAILDYNAVLPDPSLVALDRTKHLTMDLLLTYLTHPGTAIYVGYTDGYENVQLGSSGLVPINTPTTSTGRQFFVKTSYLFRF